MDQLEPPECPVCLQPYAADSVVPLVLPCGHSTCEACLKQLPNPFPHTLRCPVCTLLSKFSNSPISFPKNIDLLRLSSTLQDLPLKPKNVIPRSPPPCDNLSLPCQFIRNSWSYEFYSTWKKWIIPKDIILVEKSSSGSYGEIFDGKVLGSFESISGMGRVLKEEEKVGLLAIGIFKDGSEKSRFLRYSYESRIMSVLYGMGEKERNEMTSILNLSLRLCRAGNIYGFWYNDNDSCVYMVCENFNSTGLLKFFDNEEEGRLSSDKISGFGIVSTEMCEIFSSLISEGLVIGCLDVNCFVFNDFARVYVDLGKVLSMGRRVNKAMRRGHKDSEVSLKTEVLENLVFISPEMLLKLFGKELFELDCGKSIYEVGSGSDVWSLACLLVSLIIGSSFIEEMAIYVDSIVNAGNDGKVYSYVSLCEDWMENVETLLGHRLGLEYVSQKDLLCRCLEFDISNRPPVSELWKCLRELVIKPRFDFWVSLKHEVKKEKTGHCIVLGELCQIAEETNKEEIDGLQQKYEIGRANVSRDVVEGLSGGHIKCVDMKGHLDCITGLAIGGGFLFSSSFDKRVHVWSLQDFTHVHTFKGHEHKVMALVFMDGGQPLCISGDNEGVICIWDASFPFNEEPIKKLHEQKDWRYSGIHALAVSRTEYLYTGSGDKLIKAWSLQDHTLSCAMSGHKSVVSSLIVCNGILYSGSWDGTVRLWSLSDHSPLAVLGEDTQKNVTSVLALAADNNLLLVAHDDGCIKMWHNDLLVKSLQTHNGAVFAVSKKGRWLFTGGWDRTIDVQEISDVGDQIDTVPVGSIACDSVITAVIYWQEKLFVGQSDTVIKVYYGA
ncbi:translocase subunit SECA2, chloroplastic isoform X2 [Olea europaea subsp. europaea]|uniref:Translocase subunit SECA2, chloroplastic isoform X2 n=1 Tax=Olea europaea subsp. europaea TaxID=158383 RepID=A0A8S0V180_OLEEU|nr:translocase subunit SECA2, chloroplastic isoform X2 [Olea europaea subsp. europaea]